MNFCDYIIADRRVRLCGFVREEFELVLPSFKRFATDGDNSLSALLEVTLDDTITFAKDEYSLLTQFDLEDDLGICSFYGCAEGYALVIDDDSLEVLFLIDKQMKSARTNARPVKELKSISYLRFGLWFVVNMAFVKTRCSAVHSSTIVCQGGAVMFLGESGTGKSTHTRLWLENISGAELLNDDSPFVSIEEDGVKVYGSPWSGKTPCYKNKCYPLLAMVRLSQAPYNKITPLSKLHAMGALLPSLPPAFVYDNMLEDALLDVLSKVIGNIRLYHLECLPDAAAAALSFNTIFADGVADK